MKKKFNDTGLCIPEKHYMADVSAKIQAIFSLVENGSYFVINRPRQYGKTTTLYLLERKLHQQPDYFPIFISFEGFGSESYKSEQSFIEAFFSKLRSVFRFYKRNDLLCLFDNSQKVMTLNHLDAWITDLANTAGQRIVLMIDEVDKSSNNQLFLDFLGLLRTKYLSAAQGKDATFHSIILAGVHDVKSLKLKIRPNEERKYNSPWNIAVNFTVDMSLNPHEIGTMLRDYCEITDVRMDQSQIAQKLYYYTSGYPFLVSSLCKIIDEEMMPFPEGKTPSYPPQGGIPPSPSQADSGLVEKTLPYPPSRGKSKEGIPQERIWRPEHVDEAVSKLLLIQNTNFESLIKNLENNTDLYELVEQIVLFDKQIKYNRDSHLINLGLLYGIFICNDNLVDIHNRIYKERIYNYMTTNLELNSLVHTRLSDYNFQENFILPDNTLDMENVLLKFQEFIKHEYSQRDTAFIERNGRLIFLAFLKPIINGRGYDFKEFRISEEKRLDVVVVFGHQKYVIELKIWRGDAAHQKGLRQLHDYLECTGLEKGYLLIFDFTQKGQKEWKQENIHVEKKKIFAVWV